MNWAQDYLIKQAVSPTRRVQALLRAGRAVRVGGKKIPAEASLPEIKRILDKPWIFSGKDIGFSPREWQPYLVASNLVWPKLKRGTFLRRLYDRLLYGGYIKPFRRSDPRFDKLYEMSGKHLQRLRYPSE